MPSIFRTKICGVTSTEDATVVADSGADALGVNFYAGSKRYVNPGIAKTMTAALPRSVAKVGVFVNATTAEIRQIAGEVGLDFVQLHGDESPAMLAELASLQVIKAFRCRDSGFPKVVRFIAECDDDAKPLAILLDGYHHAAYGGTGVKLDWREVARNRPMLGDIPLILAGGLTATNVANAIGIAAPWGVDTASGVESTPGVKDPAQVRAFVSNARAAFGN